MGKSEPCCEKLGLKKGPWTPEEDHKLITYIQSHGHISWRALPKQAGLSRCGKSCRLRWTNYLRPGIKRGNFSPQEENSIIQLHAALGNRWSTISTHLPGRTDNEIKNHWNTRLRKRLLKMGIDPTTHRPLVQHASPINTLLLSLLPGAPSAAPHLNSSLVDTLLHASNSFPNKNGLFPAAPGHVFPNNSRPPAAPPSSIFPPPAALDPAPVLDAALVAAAETRLVLEFLKSNNPENHSSTSDHQLNQLLTRLLLFKLLQGSNNHASASSNPAACYEQQRSGPLSADHLLQTQGLNPAGNIMVPAANNRQTAAAPAPPSANLNENNHNNLPTTTLLNMFSSCYQQRLLQTLPFLAQSVLEPCTSAAAPDHLSSTSPHQLSQGSFFNTTANGSLTSQQTQIWPGGYNEVLPNGEQGAQLLGEGSVTQKRGDSQVMTSGGQILAGAGIMHNENEVGSGGGQQTLMTWEEHLISQQKGMERDIASSSTMSSSSLSSASQCHASPNTPTHNFNIQDYWSDILNLISSSK